LNIRVACLAAALGQILWSLLIVNPQVFGISGAPGVDWTGALMFLESLVLLFFFLAACWSNKRINGSVKVRYAALMAALCLAVENLRPPYGTLRGIVRSADSLAWRYYPFIQGRQTLARAIPNLAVVLIVIFLLVVWHASPRSEGLNRPAGKSRREDNALGVAALLAFAATIVAVGQLIFALASNPNWQTPGFAGKLALRLLSLGSLAVFFLLVTQSQHLESIGTSELNEPSTDSHDA